jgi:hypothetical protein
LQPRGHTECKGGQNEQPGVRPPQESGQWRPDGLPATGRRIQERPVADAEADPGRPTGVGEEGDDGTSSPFCGVDEDCRAVAAARRLLRPLGSG